VTQAHDVFFSYAHADQAEARDLRDALASIGVKVWLDETDIDTFDGITESVREGIANAKAFLAFYSKVYPTRRACQWELTRAFLTSQRQGDPRKRILVVNPEPGAEHIEPVELRDGLFARMPGTAGEEAVSTVAVRVKERIERLQGRLGDPDPPDVPWHGRSAVGAIRFVGRIADMWQVHSALQAAEVSLISGAHGSTVAQVVGLGGIGKSLLAAEYALRYGPAYPGGVFWLRAHGHDDVETASARVAERSSQLRDFATALGASVEGLSPAGVRRALIQVLDASGRPYLWIADDLPGGLTQGEIDDWLAPSGLGKTLVTTRSREYGAFGRQIEVGLLAEADGLDLLRAHRPTLDREDKEAARGLVRDLGGHALAIDVAGAALAAERGVRSVAEYREAIGRASPDELEFAGQLAGELPTGHERSITSTLLRSIRALGERGVDFLRIASMLAVEPIPARLAVECLRWADSLDMDTAMATAVAGMDEAHALSLAEIVGDGGGDRAVHALVSRTVRLAVLPSGREASLRWGANAALVDGLKPVLRRESVSPALVAHARHLGAAISDQSEIVLMNFVSNYDRERGDFESARLLQERLLDAARKIHGPEHVETCGVMSSLAGTLAELGEKKRALDLFTQALEHTEKALGADNVSTLSLMNNVAELRWGVGDFAGALALHERTLEGRRRLLGDDHPQTVTSMNNFAGTLADYGDLEGARSRLEEVLAIRRRILGKGHPNTLSTMNSLGIVLGRLHDYEGARTWHQLTLDGRREALGADHPYTFTSMNNLAVTLGELGEREVACSLHAETLRLREAVLGERHPDTLTSMDNLASTSGQLGRLAEARELHVRTLTLRTEVLGPEHAETLCSMSSLATTLWMERDREHGTSLQKRAAEAARRALGDSHPTTAKITGALAEMEAWVDVGP
jgi:tetratricopeptide (TPR) repeat protein